jgi:hypothetical protein
MFSAMRANTTQKAYDEAFLACSTAVYFEGQVSAQPPGQCRMGATRLTEMPTEQRERGAAIVENRP